MSVKMEYYEKEEPNEKNWFLEIDPIKKHEDYLITHLEQWQKFSGKQTSLSSKWYRKIALEYEHIVTLPKEKIKTTYDRGTPEALLQLFKKLEPNEDLASSIEGVSKWARSIKLKEIKF